MALSSVFPISSRTVTRPVFSFLAPDRDWTKIWRLLPHQIVISHLTELLFQSSRKLSFLLSWPVIFSVGGKQNACIRDMPYVSVIVTIYCSFPIDWWKFCTKFNKKEIVSPLELSQKSGMDKQTNLKLHQIFVSFSLLHVSLVDLKLLWSKLNTIFFLKFSFFSNKKN